MTSERSMAQAVAIARKVLAREIVEFVARESVVEPTAIIINAELLFEKVAALLGVSCATVDRWAAAALPLKSHRVYPVPVCLSRILGLRGHCPTCGAKPDELCRPKRRKMIAGRVVDRGIQRLRADATRGQK